METITLVDSPLDHVYGTGWPYRLGDFLFLSGRLLSSCCGQRVGAMGVPSVPKKLIRGMLDRFWYHVVRGPLNVLPLLGAAFIQLKCFTY